MFEIISGILLLLYDCLIVSSYKITPPIHFLILSDEKSIFLNANLFSDVDDTPTLSSLLVIVAVLSSAANIPLPSDIISRAILFKIVFLT